MENLVFVFEKLLSDEKLAEGFSKCKSGDEMYNFCLNIKDGYTRDEWENFIRVIYSLILNKDCDKIELRENLDKVCGGTMNNSISKKFLSCSLALLGVLPSPGLGSVKANAEAYSKVHEKASKEDQSSILPLIFKGALIGTVGVVGGAIGAYIYDRMFNSSDSGSPVRITGLGSMNSAIQQLYSLDKFCESVMNDNSGDPRVNAVKYLFSIISGREQEDVNKVHEAAAVLGYKDGQEVQDEFIQNLNLILKKYNIEYDLLKLFSRPVDSPEKPIQGVSNSSKDVNLPPKEKTSEKKPSEKKPSKKESSSSDKSVGANKKPDKLTKKENHKSKKSSSTITKEVKSYKKTPSGCLGITNPGNMCYMNAAIQQLYNLDHFRESVMNDNSGDHKVNAIKYLFSIISGKEPENADKVLEAAVILGYKGKQEDCYEFIQSLDSIFEKYGMGLCLSNPFSFNADLSGVSLQDILDHGNNMNPQLAREFLRKKLNKGPEFSDEDISRDFDKLTEKENFKCGDPLNVNPIEGQFGITINRTYCDLKTMSNIKSNLPINVSDVIRKDGKDYALTGVVVHKGEFCDSGHYVSYKKSKDGKWYIYNDSRVSSVSDQKVKEESSTDGVLFIFTDVSKL